MSWRDLLAGVDDQLVLPWTGGRALVGRDRRFGLEGALPPELCWATFTVSGRKARYFGAAEPRPELLGQRAIGVLVGDRLVPRQARVDPDPAKIAQACERVLLVEPGIDRFMPIEAGRIAEGAPLIYRGPVMPSGPEAEVLTAFLDRAPSVEGIKGVTPALDAAFRMESHQRDERERRRQALLERRRAEEAERTRARARAELLEGLGDAQTRRAMAQVDFGEAARAALVLSGAEYLDHRRAFGRAEWIVRFRFLGQRFECVVDEELHIVDAGICLRDHESGEIGDQRFTLESLPSVIKEADEGGVLVRFRHVD